MESFYLTAVQRSMTGLKRNGGLYGERGVLCGWVFAEQFLKYWTTLLVYCVGIHASHINDRLIFTHDQHGTNNETHEIEHTWSLGATAGWPRDRPSDSQFHSAPITTFKRLEIASVSMVAFRALANVHRLVEVFVDVAGAMNAIFLIVLTLTAFHVLVCVLFERLVKYCWSWCCRFRHDGDVRRCRENGYCWWCWQCWWRFNRSLGYPSTESARARVLKWKDWGDCHWQQKLIAYLCQAQLLRAWWRVKWRRRRMTFQCIFWF